MRRTLAFSTAESFMSDPDTYSEEETVGRPEAALKRMLATPHKPQKDNKEERAK